MTPPLTSTGDWSACAAFEERIPAWRDGELDDAAHTAMNRHHADCATCAALVADLDHIVQQAKALPMRSPSHDLWNGIESRLAAPIFPLTTRRENLPANAQRRPARAGHGFSVRSFAVAAAMLVALTSGVTWTVARSVPARGASPVAATFPAVSAVSAVSAVPAVVAPASSRPAANTSPASASASTVSASIMTASATSIVTASSMSDVDAIYEKEISALRRIVNQRFTELDSTTVMELRRNLEMIDQAIGDSRRALRRDPRSGLLSTELDRTLEAKLALMRRVALL